MQQPQHALPPAPQTLAPLHTLAGHSDFSTFVGLSAGAARAVTTGDDRAVRLWALDQRRPAQARVLARSTDIGWQCSLSADASVAAAACNDGAVRVWRLDVQSGAAPPPPLVLRSPGHDVSFGAALSEKGDILIATFFCAATASGALVRYRLPGGRVERSWPHALWWGRASVSISRGAELIALATDTMFMVLDGATGVRKLQRRVPVCDFDLALASSANRVVVATTESLKVYSIVSGKDRELAGYLHPLTPSVDISADGRIIVAAQKGYAFAVWRGRVKVPVLALTGHRGLVRGCALSTDGSVVVGAGVDGSVRVWDLRLPAEDPAPVQPPMARSRGSPRPRPRPATHAISQGSDSLPGVSSSGMPPCVPKRAIEAGAVSAAGRARSPVPVDRAGGSSRPKSDTDEDAISVNGGNAEGRSAQDSAMFMRERSVTESVLEPPRGSRHSLPEGGSDASEANLQRRHSESVLDRRRGDEHGSRLVSAISALAKLGFESLGIKQ